jgi:hypothetical protein
MPDTADGWAGRPPRKYLSVKEIRRFSSAVQLQTKGNKTTVSRLQIPKHNNIVYSVPPQYDSYGSFCQKPLVVNDHDFKRGIWAISRLTLENLNKRSSFAFSVIP